MRPKCITDLDSRLELPDSDASPRELRVFHIRLLEAVANLLSRNDMPASAYDPTEDEHIDYSKWTVMSDASISTRHKSDRFCKFLFSIAMPVQRH